MSLTFVGNDEEGRPIMIGKHESEPPVRSSELVMPARKGLMKGSVWTPYARRIDADGTCVILARNENGYPTEFPLYEWGTMPLA